MDVDTWLEAFDNFIKIYWDDVSEVRKMALCRHCVGKEGAIQLKTKKKFADMVTEIKTWKIYNILLKRQEFLEAQRLNTKTFNDFFIRLKNLYKQTKYDNEHILLDLLITGCGCNKL
ncbi:hypothetical protein A3Q56_03182 [Intoshia linei]|uniref:Uncharacterized protein n=1 Tax=Intoshia linei TaxID=1819745 RepID=A0A177B5U2_9BILA|nr:hypothetical protein A3Q56_03182 [Intoshia linei]